MRERMRERKLYPLGDLYPGVPRREQWSLRGRWTGEDARPPKKGEWYLSGAKVTVYRAPNDFSYSYHIAEIVRVKEVTTYKVLEALKEKKGG